MYKTLTPSCTPSQYKLNKELCNTHCKRVWWTKNNIDVSRTTTVDKEACADWQFLDISNVIWIMNEKNVVFWSNLNHSFANHCLTLILYEQNTETRTLNRSITSYLIVLFCFWLLSISPFPYHHFLFFLLLFFITRNVSERLLCQLVKQNQWEMKRNGIHLSMRSARLDRLQDPQTQSINWP